MNQRHTPIVCLVLSLWLSSCGGADSESKGATTSADASDIARFGKDFSKGCDILSAGLVASTFNVPAENLKQTKILGCIYTWGNDVEMFQASILMVQIHKTTTRAVTWFANATKNSSAQEVQAEMDDVAERLEKRAELDTTAKKSVAKVFLKAAGSEAVVYEDVANVGDEARSRADGSLSVRVGNLTFNISAYQGPKQPKAKVAGLDIKQLIEASKKAAQEWETISAPQRRQDSVKMARAVVATL